MATLIFEDWLCGRDYTQKAVAQDDVISLPPGWNIQSDETEDLTAKRRLIEEKKSNG